LCCDPEEATVIMLRQRRRAARRVLVGTIVVASATWFVGGISAAAAGGQHGRPQAGTLYVSTHAKPGKAGDNCGTAGFSSIAAAVAAAPEWGTVVVCPGTYAEDVLVQKPLSLVGRNARIDATGLENGIQITTSHVTVRGFTIRHANGEGVLAGVDSLADAGLLPASSPVLTDITIDHVRALYDDQGFNGTEQGNCTYGGDCGGGIHLNVVKDSVVRDSEASHNADGILLTDDYGPNAHNLIEGNVVDYNKTECGIVLPSHSQDAVSFDPTTFAVTGRNPDLGGVYDNVVRDNVTIGNGTAPAPAEFGGVGASGSGIGVFGSGPGSGAYDNLIEDNYLADNGLAGFTIHAHHPGGEDVNGNDVINNTFDTNNVGGDAFDGGIANFKTTGIAVYSVPPVQMTITGNTIRNNDVGIWLTDTVDASGLSANTDHNVTTPVEVEPAH
jgi:parallel beta-helix repeat protein